MKLSIVSPPGLFLVRDALPGQVIYYEEDYQLVSDEIDSVTRRVVNLRTGFTRMIALRDQCTLIDATVVLGTDNEA